MHFVSFHRGDELIKFQSFFEDSTISRIFLATCCHQTMAESRRHDRFSVSCRGRVSEDDD